MRLSLQTRDLDAIKEAAAAAFPEECCGLLIGQGQADRESRDDTDDTLVVDRVEATANIAREPRRRFEIDPAALFAAHKRARAAGRSVIGHYHSHPGGAAIPSAHDRARAFGAGEVWLIVAVDGQGVAGAARAHLYVGGDFQEIEIEPVP